MSCASRQVQTLYLGVSPGYRQAVRRNIIKTGNDSSGNQRLDFSQGQPVRMSTANGIAQGWRVRLSSVRVGDVEVYDVEAIVSQQPMPYVLLGNSFISRFSMRRDADQMVLEKRF